MDLLDRLLEHDRWATAQLFAVCAGLSDDRLDQSFDIGHRSVRDTFVHLVANIEFWTRVMLGRADASAADRDAAAPSVAALADWHERAYGEFAGFARRMRDEGRLDDLFADHFGEPQSVGGAILHVILHDEGHRTEILHILERLGVPNLPELDHALWDHVRRGAFRPA